jgi:putative ABC transport system permease protein
MGFFLTLRIALRALKKNKLRAGLTVLGVVIGIAAVTAMVSIGQSATELVEGQFTSLGPNVIVVQPGDASRGGIRSGLVPTLTADDSDAIARHCPSILVSSPLVSIPGHVVYGNSNYLPGFMFGVGHDYLILRNWPVASGGFFTERDVTAAAKVCVIGHTLVAKLFQTTNPVGQTIRIKNVPFKVIGVLDAKGANMVGQDQDDILLMPYTTVHKRLVHYEFNQVNGIGCAARSVNVMTEAKDEITRLLDERHHTRPGEPRDFTVISMTEMANVFGGVLGTLTIMISSIAGISLVVGGVGIMNIMLVSVTERTREIGIRMAVGARGRDILLQFLVEAVLLSCIGGVIGFALGCALSVAATMLINSLTGGTKWPVVISLNAAALSFFVAAAVGVFFGFYPARRASRLDPIEALRYE